MNFIAFYLIFLIFLNPTNLSVQSKISINKVQVVNFTDKSGTKYYNSTKTRYRCYCDGGTECTPCGKLKGDTEIMESL